METSHSTATAADRAPSGTTAPAGQSQLVWAALIAELAVVGHDARVLDCGGGSGSLAVPLAQAGAVVTVLDPSIDALGTLLRRASEAGVSDRVSAVQGDAEQLADLVSGSFDLILLHDMLGNVADAQAVVDAAAAVTTDEGRLSIVLANPAAVVLGRALNGDLTGALAVLERSGDESFTERVVLLCARAGLEPSSIQGVGVFSDIVPGQAVERPGAHHALQSLEQAASTRAPFRDLASKLHVIARRGGAAAPGRHGAPPPAA